MVIRMSGPAGDPAPGDSSSTARDKSATADIGQRILQTIIGDRILPVTFRLWDGRTVNSGNAGCTVTFTNPGVLRELILHRDFVRLGEAYLSGDVTVEGNLEAVFALAGLLTPGQIPLSNRIALLFQALKLPQATSSYSGLQKYRAVSVQRSNTRASIAHHYDVGNDFYRLWLDPQMVYSCAYFHDDAQSLADAQCDKLDYLCRKLRLQPGQRLLDIGCGWGALVVWAAEHYDVHAHGITLSKEQYRFACERIATDGLQDRVRVELRDYRDLKPDGRYDRVVSVGMFEHVGVANYPTYFGTIKKLLAPDGLFLNHGITNDCGWQKTQLTRFVNRYVFPDGELARISVVIAAMEEAGFEIYDVESLRRHYIMTLRHWVSTLESNRKAAVQASSEAVYRLWRLYMAGSAYYFDEGSINVYQVLAGHAYRQPGTPLRRSDLYVQDKQQT